MHASKDLSGQSVVITGAAGGLGPAVVARLADAGAMLVACDVDQGRLDAVRAEVGVDPARFESQVVDLLDAEATATWAAELAARHERLAGVVHLVGGWRGGQPLPEAPLSDYEWLHDLLVRTTQHVSRAFHRALEGSGGRFLLISSAQAQSPTATNASYAAAKAAAEAWTLALADSLGPSGAGANIIVVNAIVTAAMRAANPDNAYPTFTSADDIAAAIEYLLSPRAAKMNGARLELHP